MLCTKPLDQKSSCTVMLKYCKISSLTMLQLSTQKSPFILWHMICLYHCVSSIAKELKSGFFFTLSQTGKPKKIFAKQQATFINTFHQRHILWEKNHWDYFWNNTGGPLTTGCRRCWKLTAEMAPWTFTHWTFSLFMHLPNQRYILHSLYTSFDDICILINKKS